MIQVRVRRISKKTKKSDPKKDQIFYFPSHREAVSFTSGLRVRDSWVDDDQLFDAIVEKAVKP